MICGMKMEQAMNVFACSIFMPREESRQRGGNMRNYTPEHH